MCVSFVQCFMWKKGRNWILVETTLYWRVSVMVNGWRGSNPALLEHADRGQGQGCVLSLLPRQPSAGTQHQQPPAKEMRLPPEGKGCSAAGSFCCCHMQPVWLKGEVKNVWFIVINLGCKLWLFVLRWMLTEHNSRNELVTEQSHVHMAERKRMWRMAEGTCLEEVWAVVGLWCCLNQ